MMLNSFHQSVVSGFAARMLLFALALQQGTWLPLHDSRQPVWE
jgi:hypothetical protein